MDEDSVIFRRILKFADDFRRFPKKSRRCFDRMSYISETRVQSPESRVQSWSFTMPKISMLKIRYQADYQEKDLWIIFPYSVLEKKQQDKRQVELISSVVFLYSFKCTMNCCGLEIIVTITK